MRATLYLLLAASPAFELAAQADGRMIRGTVTDPNGRAVPYASLHTMGSDRFVADSTGVFSARVAPKGEIALRVTRLGYEPTLVRFTSSGDTSVAITLTPVPRTLEKIEVQSAQISKRLDAQGFYGRLNDRKKGVGSATFITVDDIEARGPIRITHMLQTVPGVRVVNAGASPLEGEIRGPNGCDYSIYVDGQRVHPKTSVMVQAKDRSIDARMAQTSRRNAAAASSSQKARENQMIDIIMTPNVTAGIEVYPRGIGAPGRFPKVGSTCGVAVFWSK